MSRSLLPVPSIAQNLGLDEAYVELHGKSGVKLRLELLQDTRYPPTGKLVLVTATTPTPSGDRNTLISIGLAEALKRRGKRALVTSSPNGMGAALGSTVDNAAAAHTLEEEFERIAPQFHRDAHSILTAHNLLTALIDAHLSGGNALDIDPAQITWPRSIDLATSEIVAILGLCRGRQDLRERLARIVVAFTRVGYPVLAADLNATDTLMAGLNETILPNLVQAAPGTAALVHIGTVLAQQMGVRLADYVIHDTGFASDLGAERYIDLVMPVSGIAPSAAVLVTSVAGLRHQGDGDLDRGAANLYCHVENLAHFGLPVVVAIHHFPQDNREELRRIAQFCQAAGVRHAGGDAELADHVVELLETVEAPEVHPAYSAGDSLPDKVAAVARQVYGARGVSYSDQARRHLEQISSLGFDRLPVCIAKTQFSLSDDPMLTGAPRHWDLHISDAHLKAGAGFVVLPAEAIGIS